RWSGRSVGASAVTELEMIITSTVPLAGSVQPPAAAATISIRSPLDTSVVAHWLLDTPSPLRATATPLGDGHQLATMSDTVVRPGPCQGSPLTDRCTGASTLMPGHPGWSCCPASRRGEPFGPEGCDNVGCGRVGQQSGDGLGRHRGQEDPIPVVGG